MPSPIETSLPAIFVHVSDLRRAVNFYSQLLGIPVEAGVDYNGIFAFKLDNGVDRLLDANHPQEQRS